MDNYRVGPRSKTLSPPIGGLACCEGLQTEGCTKPGTGHGGCLVRLRSLVPQNENRRHRSVACFVSQLSYLEIRC